MASQFRYFEDYQVGQKGVTGTRTVTEADVVSYACLSGDFNPIHVDRYSTADNIYGGRVAHGLFGSSLATGMLSFWAPYVLGRGVPGAYFYGIDANYRGAIQLGDTIKIHWQAIEKADDPTHQGFGLVKTGFQVVNQEEVPVYDGVLTTRVRKESAGNAELTFEPGVPWQIKEFVPDPEQVYSVEDYPIGEGGETDARTITETDVVNFACLIGDYAPQCVDAEFASGSVFGERVAHGMLVFSIAIGLYVRHEQQRQRPQTRIATKNETAGQRKIAGHLNDTVSFLAPVKIGDTIRARYKTSSARASKSRPEVGLYTRGFQIINQRDEVVQEGSQTNMGVSRAGLHGG